MKRLLLSILAVLVIGLIGCREAEPETAVPPVSPTATIPAVPTAVSQARDRDFIVIATDAPNVPFADFDKFGSVIGFNNDLMARIAAIADFEYEFVVTPNEGVLDNLISASNNDFDAVMSSLVIPEEPQPGVAYTVPYLEIGQVIVVLANEGQINGVGDIQAGTAVGVPARSSSAETAREILAINEADLYEFDTSAQALQALIDELVGAVIIDHYTAEHFTEAFPEQLKIVGGEGRAAWLSQKRYGIAVPAADESLLERLDQAIAQAQDDQTIERLTVAWLIPAESISAGESRVGTPASEFIIGITGQLADLEPSNGPDLISWEVKNNTMSGLFTINSSNQLVPMLAANQPVISEDKLEYTISLRRGLRFPDGSELTADDVQWSIIRSARLGSFLVNSYLKDANEDNFADEDAVQIVDQYTVKIILQEPTAFFLSLLATPPYYPVSNECYAETADPLSTCGGIGPYTIVSWDNERIRLKANPEWPGRPSPAFENIQVRFYADATAMLRSLTEFQSIDMAWTGLPFADFKTLESLDVDGDGTADFANVEGPAIFKSYVIFDHDTPPWNNPKVRRAFGLAVDRDALAEEIFGGSRQSLFSPVPDNVPGHQAVLPQRNLEQAAAFLLEAGYSPSVPLPITLHYLNDGRYTPMEEDYANAIKTQLEETNVFIVTLEGAPWETFRAQISQCNYPAYLIGWPSPGQPVNYLDATSWTDFFIENTDSGFCSNYESAAMTALVEQANEELDTAARLELYAQIQQLWAEELPTLDLTQEQRYATTLSKVENVRIDALGLLHYEVLTKGGG